MDELYGIICQKNPNDIKIIIELINKNKDVIKYDDGALISHAISLKNVPILNLLFKYGTDPNKCFEIDYLNWDIVDDGEISNWFTTEYDVELMLNEFGVKDTILISPLCYALVMKKTSLPIIKTIINHGGKDLFYLNPLTKIQILYESAPDCFNNDLLNHFLGEEKNDILHPVRNAFVYKCLKKNIYEKNNILPDDIWIECSERQWDWNNNVIGFEKGFLMVINKLIRGDINSSCLLNQIHERNYKILQLLLKAEVFDNNNDGLYNIIHNIDIKPSKFKVTTKEYRWGYVWGELEFRTSKKKMETNEKMCNYLKEHYDDILDKYKSMVNSVSNNNNLPNEITNNILGYLIKI